MKTSNSELRAQLGNCLSGLQRALAEFAGYVEAEARDAWVWHRPLDEAAAFSRPVDDLPRAATLRRIASAVQAIKYDDTQDAHESRIWPGIVAVASDGIRLADEINRLKGELAVVLKAMEGRLETGTLDQRTGELGQRPLREVALEAFYFRRLHYWQATRRLEVLRAGDSRVGTPEYVGFMWATSREVRRTCREELLKPAEAAPAWLLSDSERDVLGALPEGEPLAIVRPGHTTPKANIRWAATDTEGALTRVRVAVLPFVMLGSQLPERLRKLPPMPLPRHYRLARTDTEIEATPVVPGLPVFRYMPQHREAKRGLLASR